MFSQLPTFFAVLSRMGMLLLAVGISVTALAGPPMTVGTVGAPVPHAITPMASRVEAPRPQLGLAPKPVFQVNNNRTMKVDPAAPAARAVRAIPPQSFAPAARSKSVGDFYDHLFADKKPEKDKLARCCVGPFRREFVYWAWYRWELRDRAWWAWNNYAYFDSVLWEEWMLDHDFAALIAKFQAAHDPQILGFIPAAFASNSAEVIYSDSYIDAVYNPVYTTPSIVVDGSSGVQLKNLVEGTVRVFGRKNLTIDHVADSGAGLQFLSVPAEFVPTYQIDVKRDGVLYIFGSSKTSLADGVGDDAPKWHPAKTIVRGSGIDAIYSRKVIAGDRIRLHGCEWSIASEQIEILTAASQAARNAVALADAELTQLLKSGDTIFEGTPELKDYLRIAQGAEQGMLTPLGNVDDDKVGLYYTALDTTEKMATTATAQSGDPQVIASGKDLLRQVKGLETSLNEVDELRNPALPEPSPGLSPGDQVATVPHAPAQAAVVQPRVIRPHAAQPAESTEAASYGKTVDLLPLVDVSKDSLTGTWTRTDTGIINQNAGFQTVLRIPYEPADEYDYEVDFTAAKIAERGNVSLLLPHEGHAGEIMFPNGPNARARCIGWSMTEGSAQGPLFEDGQQYRMVVKVRKDGVSSYLNDSLISQARTQPGNKAGPPFMFNAGDKNLGMVTSNAGLDIHRIIVREIGNPGTVIEFPEPGEIPSLNQKVPVEKPLRVVNLLNIVDPQKDALKGTWELQNDRSGLMASQRGDGLLRLPYAPPAEYNFKVEFTRIEGNFDVDLILHKGTSDFAYVTGGMGSTICGLGLVNHRSAFDNPTTIRSPKLLVNNRKYTEIVYVRENYVAVSIDGKLITRFNTDYSDLSNSMSYKVGGLLGLRTVNSRYLFNSIEVADITGNGTLIGVGQPANP
jgi:hypothetical protein